MECGSDSVTHSDILGHADETRFRNVNMGTISTIDEPDVSLTRRVEVERRRVASNGRVKLKQSLFEMEADRCRIGRWKYRVKQVWVQNAIHDIACGNGSLRGERINLDSRNY